MLSSHERFLTYQCIIYKYIHLASLTNDQSPDCLQRVSADNVGIIIIIKSDKKRLGQFWILTVCKGYQSDNTQAVKDLKRDFKNMSKIITQSFGYHTKYLLETPLSAKSFSWKADKGRGWIQMQMAITKMLLICLTHIII